MNKWWDPKITLGTLITVGSILVSIAIWSGGMGATARETSAKVDDIIEQVKQHTEDINILMRNYAVTSTQLTNLGVLAAQNQQRADDMLSAIASLHGDVIRLQTLVQSLDGG